MRGCLKRKRVKKRASVFVFKDESEAQRQPLNFPTQWENFGGSLFLLSLLLPVFTHTRAKCFRKTKKQRDRTRQTFDFFKTDDERMREREEKRREKEHIATRDRIVRLQGPPLSISRHILYTTLISLTDKPAGARDANLQLLLRPVRLGAVDPSQGVLLARGVRSFRISHSCVIVSWCVVGLSCLLWGQKEDKKSCSEGNTFSERGNALALFPFFCSREGRRQRAEREFFHLFLCASFSRTLRSLASFSLFSLSFLSLFSQAFVRFCSNSLHT